MAVIASFKQACPSCEAMITIKENMVGKKIECTKCKDKFIAERPDDDDDEPDERPAKRNTKSDSKKSTALSAKAPSKRSRADEDDDDDGASNGKANGKASKGKSRRDDDDDDDSDKKSKKKKESGGGLGGFSTLTIGIGLAVVGVLILSIAAFFLLSGGGGGGGGGFGLNKGPGNKGELEEDEPKEIKKPAKVETRPIEPTSGALNDAELAKLTNLLPPDTEHVFHVFFKDLFHASSPLRDTVFQASALNDAFLTKKLGFSILAIDDILCAEKYTGQSWKYTVLHFKENLREEELKTALKLTPAAVPIHGQMWYQMSEVNPWLETLSRVRVGVPSQLRALEARSGDRPSFIRIHNAQTLIIGDEIPVKAFLTARGQFPQRGATTPRPAPKPKANPAPNPNPNPEEGASPTPRQETQPPRGKGGASSGEKVGSLGAFNQEQAPVKTPMPGDGQNPNPEPNPNPQPEPAPVGAIGRDDCYLTIKPGLKAMLDRMETRNSDKEKVLFSSATDMDANRIDSPPPEFNNMVVRRPRQTWDVTLLLQERKPRIRMLGTNLVQHDPLRYQLRNELTCAQESDAKEFHAEMLAKSALTVANFVKRLTNHEIQLAPPPEEKKVPPPDPNNNPNPEQKPEEIKEPELTKSQISVIQELTTLDFRLDLVPDNWSRLAIDGISTLAASSMRGEMDAAINPSLRHVLASAGKLLPEKGVSKQDVAAGQYPPGAVRRPDAPLRTDREPRNRVSWMASLLPYMGHQNLFDGVKFDQSWRAPGNWSAGNTLVPQFLDPSYPENSRLLGVVDGPLDFAATHYVGIAGVGLDAANYKRGDPATKFKQGLLSYDESARLSDVIAGRGQANTILMIQVPHDGPTGVSPWIQGGGATLRGVPEKNSIAPFVLSTDRNGKPIHHQNKRGTYALMSDGTVRFIDQNVSDDVFKAMCTMEGPAPENFNLTKNPSTPLIPLPDGNSKKPATPEVKQPSKVEPKVEQEPKPAEKKAADEGSAPLQGTWVGISMEVDGKLVPAEAAKRMVFHFNGDKLHVKGNFTDDREEVSSYKVDAKSTPKQLDFTPPSSGAKAVLCIYELSKGELTICMRHSSSDLGRPTEFATELNSRLAKIVFTKQK